MNILMIYISSVRLIESSRVRKQILTDN